MTAKDDFRRARKRITRISATAPKELEKANEESGREIVRFAKVLVPKGKTGRARSRIFGKLLKGRGYYIDFGPLSRILQGGTVSRQTKTGANRGKGPRRPFVTEALRATKASRRRRLRAALKAALKESRNG